uniref:Gamma-tubulin complex component 6 n=1 Tax=Timema cristinae TaxID=61476 RepID=A0A7R9CD18_TIMCR|nr:unnamed protein product [Timema cristinae]
MGIEASVSSGLLKDCRPDLVQKLRIKSFEILLKKCSEQPSSGAVTDKESVVLRLCSESLVLHFCGSLSRSKKLRECVDRILEDATVKDPLFQPAVGFLLAYTKINTWIPPNIHSVFKYQHFEPRDSYQTVRPYSEYPPSVFDPTSLIKDMRRPRKYAGYQFIPILGGFPFTSEPGVDLPVLGRFISSNTRLPPKSNQPSDSIYFTLPELKAPRYLQVPKPATTPLDQMGDEGYGTPSPENSDADSVCSAECIEEEDIWEQALHAKNLPQLRTWEALGQLNPRPEPPFLSESGPPGVKALLGAETLECMYHNTAMLPQVVVYLNMEELIRDLKYLILGIQSHTFPYNQEKDCFEMLPGICIEGLRPDTLRKFCDNFLTSGTYCRKLSALAETRHSRHGLIYQALCESVRQYLLFYHHAVMRLPSGSSLLGLWRDYQCYHLQMLGLAQVLLEVVGTPGPLLSRLYHNLSHGVREDITCVLYFVVRACCRVYFRFLEKWIYEGDCVDEYGEFFVRTGSIDASSQSRHYWSKGFKMVEGLVPTFLHGLEAAIFDCGKTLRLLKVCSPKDPLCLLLERDHPRLDCYLTEDQLKDLGARCRKYQARALAACGPPTSPAQLFEKSSHHESQLHQLVLQAHQSRMAVLRAERSALAVATAQAKHRQLAELQGQMAAVAARREEERQKQKDEDVRTMEEARRHEEQEDRMKEEERQKLIQYYDDLTELVEQRKAHAEMRKQMYQQRIANSLIVSNKAVGTVNAELDNNNQYQTFNLCNLARSSSEEGTCITDSLDNPVITTPNGNTLVEDVNSNSLIGPRGTPTTIHNNHVNNPDAKDRDVDLIYHQLVPTDECLNLNSDPNRNILDTNTIGTVIRNVPTKLDLNSFSLLNLETNATPLKISRSSDSHKMKYNAPQEELVITNNPKVCLKGDMAERLADAKLDHIETELEKNRRRVLHGDFNIITGASKTLSLTTFDSTKLSTENTLKSLTKNDASNKLSTHDGLNLDVFQSCVDFGESLPDLPCLNSDSEYYLAPSVITPKEDAKKETCLVSCKWSELDDDGSETSLNTHSNMIDGAMNDFSTPCENLYMSSSFGNKLLTKTSSQLVTRDEGKDLKLLSAENDVDQQPKKSGTSLSNTGNVPSCSVEQSFSYSCMNFRELPLVTDILDKVVTRKCDTADYHNLDISFIQSALYKSVAMPLGFQMKLVNSQILRHFLVEQNFLSHLDSLRSYFFLLDGEFARNVTRELFELMSKAVRPADILNFTALNSVLSRALSATGGSGQRNDSRLSFGVHFIPDYFQHSSPDVLSCLSLRYRVSYPLNILITEEALKRYDAVFAFLLKLRRISWVLEEDFHWLKRPTEPWVQLWRHEMTHFVYATQNYVTSVALQSSWSEFQRDLKGALTLEDLCLLTDPSTKLQQAIMQACSLVLKFHGHLHNQLAPSIDKLAKIHDSFVSLVHFVYRCAAKMASSGYQPHLYELLVILNMNGHYANEESQDSSESNLYSLSVCMNVAIPPS